MNYAKMDAFIKELADHLKVDLCVIITYTKAKEQCAMFVADSKQTHVDLAKVLRQAREQVLAREEGDAGERELSA